MKSDDENAVDMVKYGYNEETRNLHFRVAFMPYGEPQHALEAIRSIGEYNDFDGDKVASALEPFMNGLQYPGIEIGREGSPVIYITIKGDENSKAVVQKALADVYADELDWDGFTLRAWWD